jgi:uncharacterized glyoxalase superfamily protein PhnB
MRCELTIFGGRMHVVDHSDQDPFRSPARWGGSTVRLDPDVPDVDATFQRALYAGAVAVTPPAEAFWGDRYVGRCLVR